MPTDLEIQLTNAHLQVKQARELIERARGTFAVHGIGCGIPQSFAEIVLNRLVADASVLETRIWDALYAAKNGKDAPR